MSSVPNGQLPHRGINQREVQDLYKTSLFVAVEFKKNIVASDLCMAAKGGYCWEGRTSLNDVGYEITLEEELGKGCLR